MEIRTTVSARDQRVLAYLRHMVQEQASDLFLLAEAPPTIKKHGTLVRMDAAPLASSDIRAFAYAIMQKAQIEEFESTMECDLSYQLEGVGRFRVNVHMQRGRVGVVIRHVVGDIPSIEALNLPTVLKEFAFLKSGLVLTVGAAGTGKSTTLAAMLQHRNLHTAGHILTVEDPIEYLHAHQQSLVTQREVGIDTRSYDEALRRAMREAPDVIMIGEIRDRISMQHALHYAESGHLCLSTLHASNAQQAVQRILNFFPYNAREQLLLDLSLNLKVVVAQRLVRSKDGARVPAVELMRLTPFVADLIQKGKINDLTTAIIRAESEGMCTFDQALFDLFERGVITDEVALAHADNHTDMALRIRLAAGASGDMGGLRVASVGEGLPPGAG